MHMYNILVATEYSQKRYKLQVQRVNMKCIANVQYATYSQKRYKLSSPATTESEMQKKCMQMYSMLDMYSYSGV